MMYGLYLSAAGLQAEEYRQAVTANNLANANTNGFKRDLAVIQTRLNATKEDPMMAKYRMPVLSDQGGGVFASPTMIDLKQAALTPSANQSDFALQGPGFFTVAGDKPNEKLLTRDGQFLINNNGNLIMATTGRKVLDSTGSEISVNPTIPIQVLANGDIKQAGATVATLGVVDVSNPKSLTKIGENLLTVDDPKTLVAKDDATAVKQNAVESSGVDPMTEMVNMLEGQRVFEANAKMLTWQDGMLQQLNSMGRVA
jgi:flagellar basal body rod protein FlgG